MSSTDAVTRPQVVFVMGSGHSGSTILGVTLGNCESVFYAGELDNWLTRSGRSALGGVERTRFWSDVRAGVDGAEELFGDAAQLSIERSSALLRPDRRSERRRIHSRYRRVTEDLYRSIARTAGATHVVDTSHFPLRARELQQLDGIDMYLVFLIRDPQAVVNSFVRKFGRNDHARRLVQTLRTNADIWLTHLLALFVFLRQPADRRVLLRHEDFLLDPQREIARILELARSNAPLPDLGALRTGFPIQGNRLIRSEEVSLKIGTVERPPRSRLTEALQRPWDALFSRLTDSEARKAPA